MLNIELIKQLSGYSVVILYFWCTRSGVHLQIEKILKQVSSLFHFLFFNILTVETSVLHTAVVQYTCPKQIIQVGK